MWQEVIHIINVRETWKGNEEWSIQRHRKHWENDKEWIFWLNFQRLPPAYSFNLFRSTRYYIYNNCFKYQELQNMDSFLKHRHQIHEGWLIGAQYQPLQYFSYMKINAWCNSPFKILSQIGMSVPRATTRLSMNVVLV